MSSPETIQEKLQIQGEKYIRSKNRKRAKEKKRERKRERTKERKQARKHEKPWKTEGDLELVWVGRVGSRILG